MNQTVAIEDVKIGMYLLQIAECEGNLQVKSQGLIKSSKTIESLRKRGVHSIEIDYDRSVHAIEEPVVQETGDLNASQDVALKSPPKKPFVALNIDQQREHLAKADKLYTQARGVQSKFVKQLRSGDAPDFDALNHCCQDIIDSVFDNHEALSCLLMLKDSGDYLVEHSLNCSILLSIFAKHLELSQADIEDMTLSGLLMDLGMALLPKDLGVRTDAFSAADEAVMRTHVDIGVELIERYADFPPMVADIMSNHHERIDGSGYPKQKSGDEISLYTQMASIVDTYDALVTDRTYRSSKSAQGALEFMLENPSYDQALVQSFIDAIGLYPVGSLVHLQSGKLAIVVQKRKSQPLKPNLIAFYSIRTMHYTEVKLVDLTKSSDKILSAVRPEEFDINLPHFFRSALL